jgi:hypothetical protein
MGNNETRQIFDIKSIINDIRQEIRGKGYSNDILSFDDCFDQVFINNIRNFININPHKNIQGNKIVVLIKKIIRKLIKFYIVPIVDDQNAFNNYIINNLQLQIKYLNKKINDLEEKLSNKSNI